MKGDQRTLILGIGSDFGDDQLGLIVARELAWQLPRCRVQGLRSPLDLCDFVANAGELHIIDACRGAGQPGALYCQDWRADGLQEGHFSGTHDFDLAAALALADRLIGLPARVRIWSVEAADEEDSSRLSIQVPLSPIVAASAVRLMALIVADVNRSVAQAVESTHHA